MQELWPIEPAAYTPHPLHRTELVWPQSNCYVDLWIELLHTFGVEPLAAMPFTFAVDLEGDQWTFFKFPLADLDALYGIQVFELNVWDSLPGHVEQQLSLGRPCLVEVDAFHMPDTAGTSYHAEHVKTSIGIQAIDVDGGRLGYFHNAGYYELDRRDFNGVFRHSICWAPPSPTCRARIRFAGTRPASQTIWNDCVEARSNGFTDTPSPPSVRLAQHSNLAAPTCDGCRRTASRASSRSPPHAMSSRRQPRRCSSRPRVLSVSGGRSMPRRWSARWPPPGTKP